MIKKEEKNESELKLNLRILYSVIKALNTKKS